MPRSQGQVLQSGLRRIVAQELLDRTEWSATLYELSGETVP